MEGNSVRPIYFARWNIGRFAVRVVGDADPYILRRRAIGKR